MTNDQYIRKLPRRQLADLLIKVVEEPDYDEDHDGEMRWCGNTTVYISSDGQRFWDDYEGALTHECWWLAQRVDNERSQEV